MTIRARFALSAAALLLALPALVACGGGAPTVSSAAGPSSTPADTSSSSAPTTTPSPSATATTASPSPSASAPAPSAPAPSAPAPSAPAPSSSAPGDATAAGGKGGADSPEHAAQVFFRGMGTLRTARSCAMATTNDGTKPLVTDPAQFSLCKTGLEQAAKSAPQAQLDGMATAVVTKVKVAGDSATVRPQDVTDGKGHASSGTGTITCKRIAGRWYVDVSTIGS